MNVPISAESIGRRSPGFPAGDFAFRMNDLRGRRYCCVPPWFITGRKIAMPRAQYFVTKRNGEWKIRAGYRYSGPYPTKRKALQVAIDFAERDGQAGREAQVLVQGEDRLFRPAWTYGRDPYPVETPASAGSTLSAGSTAKSG
jgi:hypothetical protein